MEIDTESLTEDAYKVDEFAGKVTLLVEAQVGPSFSCSVISRLRTCNTRSSVVLQYLPVGLP